ncbi:hypothetical protein FACUT_2691 [Fusarium acutatum]|uniref:CHAT domain-containing protein n=1 Tax=Fusarium acutatum TaxID=78861 RepID=A0A8H4K285_9HYPO|nr:hypothetical protein FACUT_2691 [Fusarium acutatum]
MESLQTINAPGEKPETSTQNNEARISILTDRIKQLKEQFIITGHVQYFNQSLEMRREILALTQPEDHQNKALRSHLLSNELSDRFAETDDLDDMEEAIELGIQALDLTPEGNPRRIVFLRRLEFLFEEKYGETEDVADLDEVIHYQKLLIDATDSGNTSQMAARLTALGAKLDKRSEVTREISDLDKSIEILRQVVEIKPGNESALKNLIQTLYNRYKWNGKLQNLKECVELHQQITDSSATHRDKVEWMITRANHLCILHERTEDEAYLEKAFAVAEEALALIPESCWKSRWLHCLGRLFGCRYLKTEVLADLEEAIRLERLALELMPNGDKEGWILTNLGNRLGDRYLRTDDAADIDEAIDCARKSLDLEPENPERLYNLAIKLGDRFSRTEDLDDVDEAIELERKALQIMPVDHSERADYLNILGDQLGDRYEHTGDLGDLEEAIRNAEEALGLMSQDHALRAVWLNGLATCYLNLYTTTGDEQDLKSSIKHYELALYHEASATEDRITAGQAILSNSSDSQQLYDTAKLAVSLIPKLVSWSHENHDRQYVLSKVVGLASDAAAAALQAGQSPITALQLLEQGRGIIGASLQDIRSDVQDLARQHPYLAERYRTLQSELDRHVEHGKPTGAQSQASVNRRHAAAKEFTELVTQIRELPGYQDFMLSHSADEIYMASERGPIVVINVSRLRCDALLVSDNQVRALALPSITLEELELKIKPWALATSQTLEWLWDTTMSPILNTLGFVGSPPKEKWPRVWWIPTGPLVQLPLHAAGYHRQQGSEAVLDRVISSYGSSIRNIIRGRRDNSQSSGSDQALLVAMEHTPSHDTLSFANEEVELIDGMIRSMNLESIIPTRTKEEVMRYLPDCKIFHFAGHGLAHAEDPSKSCLLLEDWEQDSLKVSDLLDMNHRQRAPFLAYLSACGTGQIKDETSFDENINLISAFQIAGFRHVIGTLWNVQDDLSVEMAKMTYQELLNSGISDESICRGLHKATFSQSEEKQEMGWFGLKFSNTEKKRIENRVYPRCVHKASNARALSSHLLQDTSPEAKSALRGSHPIKLSISVTLSVVAREASDQAVKARGTSRPRCAASSASDCTQSKRSAAVTELENAVAHFQATLTDDDRKRLQGLKELPHDAQSIIVFTAELDMQQSGNRRGKSIASRLTSFLQIIQQFTPIIDTYIQSNPDISALIWGSIKLTFTLILIAQALTSQVWRAIRCSFQTEIRSYVESVKAKAENAQREIELAKAQADCHEQRQQNEERQKASQYRQQLSTWVTKYSAAMKDLQDLKEKHGRDKKRGRLINELTSYNFMPTFNSMRNKRHMGTAEWCFHTPEYQEWVNASKTAILHITGKKRLCRVPSSRKFTSFFFLRFDERKSLSASTVIRSCLQQLLASPLMQSLGSSALSELDDCLEKARSSLFSVGSLRLLFTTASKNLDDWFIIIDGLDEVDVARQVGLLIFLRDVFDHLPEHHRIKLLLSSRETCSNDIDRILPAVIRLSTGLLSTSSDIRVYAEDIIRNKIATNELIVSDSMLVNEIIEVIHRKEKGIQALQEIPVDLPATFDRTLGRIAANKNNIAIVQKAFTLIQGSFEPLTLDQLGEALSVEIGQRTLDNDDLISGINRLPTWCQNLISVEESDTVHFSHHSIQKYLLTPGSGDFQELHLEADKCDRFMGELCVTYISLDNFQRAVGFTKSFNMDSAHMNIDMGSPAAQTMHTAVGGSVGSLIGRFTREAFLASRTRKDGPGKVQCTDSMLSSIPMQSFGPAQSTMGYTFFEYASEHWFKHQLCIDSSRNEATWRLLGHILRRPRQYSQGEPWFQPGWTKGVSEIIGNDILLFGLGFDSYLEAAVSLETDENATLMNTAALRDLCHVFMYAIQKGNAGLACRVFMLLVEDYKRPANRRLHGYLSVIINRMAARKTPIKPF